jgi:hypothetical protein
MFSEDVFNNGLAFDCLDTLVNELVIIFLLFCKLIKKMLSHAIFYFLLVLLVGVRNHLGFCQ